MELNVRCRITAKKDRNFVGVARVLQRAQHVGDETRIVKWGMAVTRMARVAA